MLSLRLAFRNMIAHGQRSGIMFLAVGLVSCFVFLFMAFSDGEIKNFKDGIMAIYQPPADILVTARGLLEADESGEDWEIVSSKSITDAPSLLAELLRHPGVAKAAMLYLQVNMDIQTGGQRYKDFWFRSFDVEHEWQILPYVGLKEGAWFSRGDKPQIMLHYKSASGIKVRPGDMVLLTGRDLFGQVISQEAVFSGFYAPGQDNPNLESMGYMNKAAYDLVSGFNPGEGIGIDLKVADGYDRAKVISSLVSWNDENGKGLEFKDRDSDKRSDGGIYELIRVIFLFVSVLIVFVVSFGVMSVVSVNLYDRKREIGTYYCLGSEKWFLIQIYTAEIFMLNLAATISGIGLGLLIRAIINGMEIRTEDAGLQLVFGGSQFNLGFSAESTIFLIGMMMTVTIVTALTTLGKRLKVSPIAALRETE